MSTLLYAVAFVIGMACFFFSSSGDHRKNDQAHWTMVILIQFVNMGYLLLASTKTPQEAIIANDLIVYEGTILPVVYLASMLNAYKIRFPRWLRIFLYLTGFALLLSAWHGSDHGIYFKSLEIYQTSIGPAFLIEEGPMRLIQYVFDAAIIFSMIIVTIDVLFIHKRKIRWSIINLYIFQFVLVAVTASISVFVKLPFLFMPFTYVICMWASAICFRAGEYYDVEEIAAKNRGKTNAVHGYVAFNLKKEFVGCTERAVELVPELANFREGRNIKKEEEGVAHEFEIAMLSLDIGAPKEIFIKSGSITSKAELSHYYLKSSDRISGYLFELTDDTDRQSYIEHIETQSSTLEKQIQKQETQVVDIQKKIVFGLANMIENRDANTGGHVKRTSDIVQIIIAEMIKQDVGNISSQYANDIVRAAPMHDLGKIAVDNEILLKPGRLTDEEFEMMKSHAPKSGDIVKTILEGVEEKHFVDVAFNIARYHHEKWNGKGYPDGLKENEIPLEARIMALADVYDALVSRRIYKSAMSFDQAYDVMIENMGVHFDPMLEDIFIKCRPQLENYYSSI